MGFGFFLLRVVVGGLLIGHGGQKLYGWWDGPGLDGAGGWFHGLGHRPGRVMAAVASLSEGVGGSLLVLGLLTPLAAAMVVGVMTVAGSVHRENGVWNSNGGFELPLVIGAVGAAFGYIGPGTWSMDHAVGLTGLDGFVWGTAALVIGLLAASVVLIRQSHVLAQEAEGAAAYPEAPAGTEERITTQP